MPNRDDNAAFIRLVEVETGAVWQLAKLRVLTKGDGSTGLFMDGGFWKMNSRKSIKVFDRTDAYRITIVFTNDFRTCNAYCTG